MLDAVRGFIAPYVNVVFIATAISAISLLLLRAFNIDAYRARTRLLFLPLAGSLILSLYISPSCFAHYLSMDVSDPAHIICSDPTYAYITWICSSWVGLTSLSFTGAAVLGAISYYYGGAIAKRIYSADEVDEEEIGSLYGEIIGLAEKAGIDDPEVYILESSTPRIFSYGGHGWPKIYVSVGLLEVLEHDEVLAAISHEISHIKNNDTLLKSTSLSLKIASLFNVVGFIVDSMLSRDREFLADKEGAMLTGNPCALASALIKLAGVDGDGLGLISGTLSLSMFNDKTSRFGIFSRHPPLEERVRRLLEL